MARRKSKKQRKTRSQRPPRRATVDVEATLERAQQLLDGGRAGEAIPLLEPLVEAHPRLPEPHFALGYARFQTGDVWDGLDLCERAQQLSRIPNYWYLLALLYAELELNAHTLSAARQAASAPEYSPPELREPVRGLLAEVEGHLAELSGKLGLPDRLVERGLHAMEEGIRALNQGRYRASAAASRRAAAALGNWPPPNNNLSLALFYDGRPHEAVTAAQRVLDGDPNNVQALSNCIRFLVLSDREEEARRLWARLVHLQPEEATERIKVAEAAAFLEQDASVHRVLRPLDDKKVLDELSPTFAAEIQYYLGVAEANTGRARARRRLQAVREIHPQVERFLDALSQGKPGPGWSERYPYFGSSDLLPRPAMEEWIELVGREERMSESRFRAQVERFVARYPQMVRLAEKLIWEEDLVEPGSILLVTLDTAAARAALRRFGLSQAGDDEARMGALYHLLEVGEIEPGAQVRVWKGGEWTELIMQRYDISDEYVSAYSSEIVEQLDAGTEALEEQAFDRAERLLRQLIEREPQVKEAYYNLSIAYSRQGRAAEAQEMLRAALDIDPLYVMARSSLALYSLDQDGVQGALAVLEPLTQVTRFNPYEMAYYAYVQARIMVAQDDLDAARQSLRMALDLVPDHGPAQDLLERIDAWEPLSSLRELSGSWFERELERRRKRRIRLQAKLSTLEPGLSEALSLYTKDALTGMGRDVIPWGGWSALRKAELIAQIVSVLTDADLLSSLVAGLEEPERAALHSVIEHGGAMPWAEFDARYGNDLEESPYWDFHQPESVMGRLRERGLLVEAKVDDELWVVVPVEVRALLAE